MKKTVRFLKSALQVWLRFALLSSKEALLAMAGAYEDDPYLADIVRTAYQRRGRPADDGIE